MTFSYWVIMANPVITVHDFSLFTAAVCKMMFDIFLYIDTGNWKFMMLQTPAIVQTYVLKFSYDVLVTGAKLVNF